MEPTLNSSLKSIKCPNCGASVTEDSVRCDFCGYVVSITACPSCFGPIFKGMRYCPGCGATVDRKISDSNCKLPCPRCEKALLRTDLAGTQISECDICGGFWVNRETFEKICADSEKQEAILIYHTQPDAAEERNPTRPSKFYVPCPECGNLMNRKNFVGCSGVIVDICKDHGVWLDRQELQKIILFIRNGGLQKAREMEISRLKEEQQRLQDMKRQSASGYAPFQNLKEEESSMDAVFTIINVLQAFFKD